MILRLSRSVEERLERLAHHSGLTTARYVREMILRHIEDEEDIREAERILQRVATGREQTYTLDEVARRLGLDS